MIDSMAHVTQRVRREALRCGQTATERKVIAVYRIDLNCKGIIQKTAAGSESEAQPLEFRLVLGSPSDVPLFPKRL
jgi:hypothetical protein